MSKMLARTLLVLAMAALAPPSWGQASTAKYPSKTVRIIVGYTPGTTSDVFARIIAKALGDRWGQGVIVENRDGAAGSIGADVVAKSEPDGYALMLTSNAFTLGPALRSNLPYDPFKDFVAVTQVAQSPNIILVGRGLGVSNLKEFIALAKSDPKKLQYASSGRGTPSHVSVELFKSLAGISV